MTSMLELVEVSKEFGGIRANVESCLYAARRGVKVVVASGRNHKNLPRILRGEEIDATVFRPQK